MDPVDTSGEGVFRLLAGPQATARRVTRSSARARQGQPSTVQMQEMPASHFRSGSTAVKSRAPRMAARVRRRLAAHARRNRTRPQPGAWPLGQSARKARRQAANVGARPRETDIARCIKAKAGPERSLALRSRPPAIGRQRLESREGQGPGRPLTGCSDWPTSSANPASSGRSAGLHRTPIRNPSTAFVRRAPSRVGGRIRG